MNLYWIYDLPNWLFGALTIGVTEAIGLGGLFATRKWVQYTRQVIDVAWPLQRRGIVPQGEGAVLNTVQSHLVGFEPRTEGQKALYAEAYRAQWTIHSGERSVSVPNRSSWCTRDGCSPGSDRYRKTIVPPLANGLVMYPGRHTELA